MVERVEAPGAAGAGAVRAGPVPARLERGTKKRRAGRSPPSRGLPLTDRRYWTCTSFTSNSVPDAWHTLQLSTLLPAPSSQVLSAVWAIV